MDRELDIELCRAATASSVVLAPKTFGATLAIAAVTEARAIRLNNSIASPKRHVEEQARKVWKSLIAQGSAINA